MVWILFVLFLIINSIQHSKCNPLISEDQHVKNQSETIDILTLKTAADDYEKCMISSTNEIGKQLAIENTPNEFVYVNFFKKACNQTSDFLKCQEIYTKIFDRFDEYKEKLAESEQYLKDTFDYICYNNSERAELFAINNGLECLMKEKTIKNCGPGGGFEFIAYVKVAVNPTLLIPPTTSDQNRFCKNAESYWNCVVEEMETCESKIPANVIKGLIKHVFKHNACNQFLNQQ